MTAVAPLGSLLRRFRSLRKMSQLDLSIVAGVSARHVSFVESGRARPSREMLLVLGRALDLPLREQNALLEAGGFAASFGARGLDSKELAVVARSVQTMLRHLDPHPSIALDAQWSILFANRAARWLFGAVVGGADVIGANLARLAFSRPARERILNWGAVAGAFLERLRREALLDARSRALLDDLAATGVIEGAPAATPDTSPVIPVVVGAGGVELAFFTMVTTLGTPLDVTLQELRIETYFPNDESTERFLASLL